MLQLELLVISAQLGRAQVTSNIMQQKKQSFVFAYLLNEHSWCRGISAKARLLVSTG